MLRTIAISVLALVVQATWAQSIHEVRRLDIKPNGEDYAPVWLDSGFVMCSVRENDALVGFVDAVTGKPLSDLYWVSFKDGRAGSPVLFSQNLATPVNEGPATFTDGGRTICFTRNQVLPKKLSNMRSANGQLGLFISHLDQDSWSPPEPLPFNDPRSSIVHPAFSPDGRWLFFSSDRPGGFGGMDLYRSERGPQGWGQPENLGPLVNGAGNEVYPRIQADGTLHFSSNRPGGNGGLDIYACIGAANGFSEPHLLPAPVNSAFNDHGYHVLPDGYRAFFASDRDGRDAIFMDKVTVPKFRECSAQKPNNYCYSLRKRPLAATSAIPVDHYWDMGDGTRIKGYLAQHCYNQPGTYTVRSMLLDRKTGDLFHLISEQNLDIVDNDQAWIATQDTIRTGRRFELHAGLSHVPGIKPAEHHWDLGDGSRSEGVRVVHAFKQPGTYTIKLDIIGVPDSTGRISNRCNTRTVVVLDRFKDHEDQAVVATYQDAFGKTHSFEFQELPFDDFSLTGEALADVTFSVQLFASKQRVDLDDARFVAIRKHYRVVERYDPASGLYTYSVGETKTAEELYQVFRKVKELQFLDAEVHAIRIEQLMDLSQLDLAKLQDLNNKKLRTTSIHFAFKSAELEAESEPVLEHIMSLLRQHPDLHLVIEAHTDDVGSRQYNLQLSQYRAMSVVEYLVERDVDADRLVPVGHGKNQPVASNSTEEGRAQNRRVEFRMVVKAEALAPREQLSGATPSRASRR